MGVRGWNTLLAREGWLVPTREADDGSDRSDHLLWMNPRDPRDPHQQQRSSGCSSLLLDHIEPIPYGSAFHIDGLGLCFHLHAAAYQRQVSSASMSAANSNSMHLVRTFLPLEKLHEITLEFIHTLQAAGIATIVVYWDGTRRPRFKAETQRERHAHRDQEWSLLQTYCRSGGRLPRPNHLANAFPISPLAQTQIYHTLTTTCDRNIRMVQCDGEADIDMARAVVTGRSGAAFVVANDSDFCFMANISYIPLSTLHQNENGGMSAIVLQRKRLAESLDLSDETLLVEAALMLGNDYYQPPPGSSSGGKSPSAVIAFLQEQDPGFRLEAPNILAAARMAFVRDLYNLRDNNGEYAAEETQRGDNRTTSPEVRSRLEERDCFSFKPTYRVSERALEPITQLHRYDNARDAIVECLERYVNEDPPDLKREHIQALLDMHRGDRLAVTLDCPRWTDVVASHILESTIVRLYRRQPILPVEPPYEVYPSAIQFCEALHRNRTPLAHSPSITATTQQQQPLRSDVAAPLNLPVDEFEVKILDSVKRNRVTIIQGETGCGTYHVYSGGRWMDAGMDGRKNSPQVAGKSTRVPLMLLQQAASTKIFICQPRRLAVKSIVDYLRKTAPEPLRHQIALRMGHGIRGTFWPNTGGRSFVSPFLEKSTRIARPEHGLSPPDTWYDC
jgi:hypothetical protein